MRTYLRGIVYVLACVIFSIIAPNVVQAADGDTDWQIAYDYTLNPSNGTITLNKYKGSETDLVVPGKAVIDGVEYQTALKAVTRINDRYSIETCIWYNNIDDGENITSLVFEEGIKLPSDCGYMFYGLQSANIIDVSKLDTSNVTDMRCMFFNCSSLSSLNVSNWNTSKVTSMLFMFYNCSKLTNLDVSNFNTSNVTSMYSMFKGCAKLASLDVSNFNTSKVTNMSEMFNGCSSLSSLNVSNWNTGNATNMSFIFYNCSSLTNLDVSNFNTSNITNMAYTFNGCSSITKLNISNFNMSNVVDSRDMFSNCNNLCFLLTPVNNKESITLPVGFHEFNRETQTMGSEVITMLDSNQLKSRVLTSRNIEHGWDISNAQDESVQAFLFDDGLLYITGSGEMIDWKAIATYSSDADSTSDQTNKVYHYVYAGDNFYSDIFYTPVNWAAEGFVPWGFTDISSKVKTAVFSGNITGSLSYMFTGMASLETVDFSDCTIKAKGMHITFGIYGSSTMSITAIKGLGNIDVSEVTDMVHTFRNCSKLTSLDISNWNASHATDMSNMFYGCSSLTSLDLNNFNTGNVTNMSCMFYGCSSLTDLDVSNFNTGNVTNMSSMFNGCSKLTSLEVSNFDTAEVTDMGAMFHGCSGLTNLNLVNFNTCKVTNMKGMFNGCSKLTSLGISSFDTSNVIDMTGMFYACSGLTNLNLVNFNTCKVTNMSSMFNGCSGLTSLDLSESFDTSNVTNMSSMFNSCSKLTNLDVSNFNTSNVTDMSSMFASCSKLTNLDVSNFNTSNVTNMSSMFASCSELTSLDLSDNFDTSKVTSVYCMFNGCSKLTSLDTSKWNTGNVTNMIFMFNGCSKLTSLDTSKWNTSNVTNMNFMFDGCSSLTKLDLSNFDMSKVTNVMYMFSNCTSLHYLKTPIYNTLDIVLPSTFYEFNRAENSIAETGITTLSTGQTVSKDLVTKKHVDINKDLKCDICGCIMPKSFTIYDKEYLETDVLHSPWDISKKHDGSVMAYLFSDGLLYITGNGEMIDWSASVACSETAECVSTTNTIVSTKYYYNSGGASGTFFKINCVPVNWVTEKIIPWSFLDIKDQVKKVYCEGSFSGSAACLFAGLGELTSADFTAYTGKPTDFTNLFIDCIKLEIINGLRTIDTSQVTRMSYMFGRCSGLTSLNVNSFDTSNVTSMYAMFTGCSVLTSLNLSNFNTSKVTSMYSMFYGCSGLTSLDVSNFNNSNVTDMSSMFSGCSSLQTLNLSNFDTGSVTNMAYMFNGCSSLQTLNISNFNTSNVTDMSSMFNGCSALTNLDVSNFDTGSVTNMVYMFNGCSALTNLDASNFDTGSVTNMAYMFYGCSALTNLDVSNFDNSSATNMGAMFKGCSGLTSLNLSNFGTGSATNMGAMFHGCSALTNLDLSNFDTSKVTNMSWMFDGCSGLTSLNLSNFGTGSVTDMSFMFTECSALTNLNLSNFNTSKVTNMGAMFSNCSSLQSLNLSSFNMSAVTNVLYILRNCTSLHYLKTPIKNTIEISLPATYYEFNKSANSISETGITTLTVDQTVSKDLVTINHPDINKDFKCDICEYIMPKSYTVDGKEYIETDAEHKWDISKSENESVQAFLFGDGLLLIVGNGEILEWKGSSATVTNQNNVSTYDQSITDSNLTCYSNSDLKKDPTYVPTQWRDYKLIPWAFNDIRPLINKAVFRGTITGSTSYLFLNCSNLASVDYTDAEVHASIGSRTYMNCSKLTSLKGYTNYKPIREEFSNATGHFRGCSKLTSIDLSQWITPKNTYYQSMFRDCSGLTSLDVSMFDTSGAFQFAGMFKGCSKLTSLNVNNFDTSNATAMNEMFMGCSKLTSLNLSNFNTEKVTAMFSMFAGCSSLNSLNVSSFNTGKVTDMSSMFNGCSSLTTLNLSNFSTISIDNMGAMFKNCSGLKSITLSSFQTNVATNMSEMFSGCTNLQNLDLSKFNTSKVSTMDAMFSGCTSIQELDLSNFDMSKVTDATGMLASMSALAKLTSPKNCVIDINLSFRMYNEINTSFLLLPKNSIKPIVLTRDPNFDYNVTVPSNIVLKLDDSAGLSIEENTKFVGDPEIKLTGSFGDFEINVKSTNASDADKSVTLSDGNGNTMICTMQFMDTNLSTYVHRFPPVDADDFVRTENLVIPMKFEATGHRMIGQYTGNVEFSIGPYAEPPHWFTTLQVGDEFTVSGETFIKLSESRVVYKGSLGKSKYDSADTNASSTSSEVYKALQTEFNVSEPSLITRAEADILGTEGRAALRSACGADFWIKESGLLKTRVTSDGSYNEYSVSLSKYATVPTFKVTIKE